MAVWGRQAGGIGSDENAAAFWSPFAFTYQAIAKSSTPTIVT